MIDKKYFKSKITLNKNFLELIQTDIEKAKKELKKFLKNVEKKEKIKLNINDIINNIKTIKEIEIN